MVDILLATYNGEKYLDEQIASIISQTYHDWRIIARDDGSSDGTPEILERFKQTLGDKMIILRDGDKNLGCIKNFSRLLSFSDAEYTMFCDQDDVWLPEKTEITLEKMKSLEAGDVPVLVHTDLRVVDSQKNTLAESFVKLHGLNAEPENRAGLMYKNSVTGCTVMINSALRELAGDFPGECTMHDHYLAQTALALGKLGFLDSATMLYRQHGGNVCGSNKKSALKKLGQIFNVADMKNALKRTGAEINKNLAQAKAVYGRFSGRMDEETRSLYELALNITAYPRLKRVKLLKNAGILPVSQYDKRAVELYYKTFFDKI